MEKFISHFEQQKLIKETNSYKIYELQVLKGLGQATVYKLFPGIELSIMEVSGEEYYPLVLKGQNAIEINYVLAGRAEFTMKDGCLQYIGEGDIFISTPDNHSETIFYPTKEFKAIVLYIDFDHLNIDDIEIITKDRLNIEVIARKFLKEDQCFLLQARSSTINFFGDLDYINESRLNIYFKLKTLELLLFLDSVDPLKEKKQKSFLKEEVNIAKEVERFTKKNINKRYTIKELASQFHLSETTLKTLFKEIFGSPISTYLKNYRIKYAKELLLKTNQNISEIALQVGYSSQSKFGEVFKKETGLAPTSYRDVHLKRNRN